MFYQLMFLFILFNFVLVIITITQNQLPIILYLTKGEHSESKAENSEPLLTKNVCSQIKICHWTLTTIY